MKIIGIARNYANHVKEFDNKQPKEPVFFLKPDTSLLRANQPFFYPEFSKEIHYEVELVLRIVRIGKHIEEQFANRYYTEVGIGIDFTARDVQREAMKEGNPWVSAKGFDGAAPLSDFILLQRLPNKSEINFELKKNGETVQTGNSKDMIFSFDKIVSHVSKFLTLKIGDLIYTGTPEGVGPVVVGDKLTAYIEGKEMLSVEIK